MCHTHNDHWSPFECLTKREVSRLVSSGTKQWKRWGGLEEWGPSGEWAKRHVTSYPSGRTRKDCGVNQYLGKVRYLVLYAPRTYTYCTIQSADCWLLTPLALSPDHPICCLITSTSWIVRTQFLLLSFPCRLLSFWQLRPAFSSELATCVTRIQGWLNYLLD